MPFDCGEKQFPQGSRSNPGVPFFVTYCRRWVDWNALALPLGTPRLQQEVCSFHSLNIIQVLMIKAGWNSMNRIDYSTLFTADSSLARPARHTHRTQPPRLSSLVSECGTYTSPVPCRSLLWVQKARLRARASCFFTSTKQANLMGK